MKTQEYIQYLNSDAGRAALKQAAALLKDPSAEFSDGQMVDQVEAIGFPRWAALRVFWHCTKRFAPQICESCKGEFKPKALTTIGRALCRPCIIAQRGPEAVKRHRARQIATYAQTNGLIQKQPCQRCGFDYDLHKHHPDYSRPLHIVWLCVRCHAKEHRELEKASRETNHATG